MTHPRYVAFDRIEGHEISTVLLQSGDCFETAVFTPTGREKYLHQVTDREQALKNHAHVVELCRAGVVPEKAIYVSFEK